MKLPAEIFLPKTSSDGAAEAWDIASIHSIVSESADAQVLRTTERAVETEQLLPTALNLEELTDEYGRKPIALVMTQLDQQAKAKRWTSLVLQSHDHKQAGQVFCGNDARGARRWLYNVDATSSEALLAALNTLAQDKNLVVWPQGNLTRAFRALVKQFGGHQIDLAAGNKVLIGTVAYQEIPSVNVEAKPVITDVPSQTSLSHLDRLEAESMHIMREVMAQAENPVMLYSVGKDSSVMLHLAKKAFYPSPPPFPLMHVDTRWKFKAMYEFRDDMAKQSGMDLIIHVNPEGIEKDINPFEHGSSLHTDIMKTQGLKQALDKYKFDVAFGGARRDEEKSRAKERVFSFRTPTHRWDPKNQRPELWNQYNGYKKPGESIRVFPLSNWTELDIWQYIYRENIPLVPLYYAAERPVVERDGMLMMVDDDRLKLFDDEKITIKKVRFRTLGCYPLTGAVESDADDLSSIVLELLQSRTSERQGRAIDSDSSGSMEKKKQEGYF